jgi:hypothetical protein
MSLMAEQIEDDESIEDGAYLFKVYKCPKNASESEVVANQMREDYQGSMWARDDDGSLDRASDGESMLISQGEFDAEQSQ